MVVISLADGSSAAGLIESDIGRSVGIFPQIVTSGGGEGKEWGLEADRNDFDRFDAADQRVAADVIDVNLE